MSETLRDLVVSLSLQTDNFTRNIKSVNKQIAEAESKFRLAAAGVEDFERTTTGLSTQASMLQRRLTLQQQAVTQYERALTAADAKLQECVTRQSDYAQRLTDAKSAQEALKAQVAAAAQQVRTFSATLGESDSATISAKANLDALKTEYRASVQEVKKLAGQNTALSKSAQNAADAVSTANTNLNNARAAVKNTQAELNRCNQSLALAQTRWDEAGKAIDDSRAAITTFGKQISLAESRFKLATVGIKELDTSVTGLTAKQTLLTEKLNIQRQSLTQYEAALQAAKEQLQAAQQVNDPERIRQASDAVIDAETALNRARTALASTSAEIEQTNLQLATARSAWTAAGKSLDDFGKKCSTVSKGLTTAGRVLTTTATTPMLALGTTAIKASLDFESSFTSVRKTVDATEAEFDALAEASKTMSTQIAASTTEINEVMATAGQLGIDKNYLANFTRTMIDLGNSTDIVANEAASVLAKFANITGMDQSEFGNLGATLVDLGNKFATTESSIMEMSLRLAAAGHQVGLSEAQILGFAAALSSVGIEAEMGGSAFSKALVKMEVAAATGGQALDDFARVSGMTAEQFKLLFESDPAAAFQSFITGLAQMDEEGMSAIATLNDIGIAEVRLRDTLLRAVNANELFAETQGVAIDAWRENTALTEEAGKRYATTESRLTNLKNTALLFAQQLGDDLNPTIQELIDGASELLNGFMEMDAAQRMQIIRMAAYAAAAGPVLLMLGKVTKGIGTLSTGIGKFATAVGKAGGGVSGLLSVLGSSPAVWLAVAAGTVAATVALVDYVSGAKQAREALESMQATADKWKRTAAETFYGGEGLSFFGMSDSDFSRQKQTAQDWLSGLLKVWSDGEKETDEIVTSWTDSFRSLTASTRDELSALKASADESGYTHVSEQLAADIATLDSLDTELAAILKKRQNGTLSVSDQIKLQELIDTREAIEIKYNLTPADDADGFDEITQKVQAEIARAQARGQTDADVTVYENAVKAAAEGMAAVNAEIDAQYDKEYAVLQLIEDSAERQAAMDALNQRYNADRLSAAREYAQTLAGVVMPVWEQADIQQASDQVDALFSKLREYSMANETEKPAILESLADLSADMDEESLTEYLGLLTQIQSLLDSGMSEDEVQSSFPDIDVSDQLDQFAGIADYIGLIKEDMPGLYSMFDEPLPEEVLKIATDLDMTGAQARWAEFAANPGSITTDAIITGYTDAEGVTVPKPQTRVVITGYDYLEYQQLDENTDVALEVPVRLGELDETELDEKLSSGKVQYWQNGVEVPVDMVPENAITPDTVAALDEDGTLHVLITPEITGTQEAIESIRPLIDETDKLGMTALGSAFGSIPSTTMDLVDSAIGRLQSYQNTLDYNWWDKFWASVRGESTDKGVLDTSMKMDFSAETVAGISAYVSELVAAIQQGQEISETDLTNLQNIVTFLNGLDVTGTGQHVKEGVAQGMTEAGWESDAATVATNLQAALNAALGIHSPSTLMRPTGENVAAGVGAGMNAHDFGGEASALAGRLRASVTSAMSSSLLRPAGLNAMRGLVAGINAGRSQVISAMRSTARAAVNAAKSELKINSPSKVFEDEVGVMAMRGLGQGVLKESREQARVIRNAARYLTGEAQSGAIATTNNDNRRTYNSNVSSTIQVQQLVVRDEQDIRALATELAALTRRQQRGKGFRMA